MGDSSLKIEENKSKGENFKAFCATCKTETNHLVAQSVDTAGSKTIQ
jgi:ribosomal protein L44E